MIKTLNWNILFKFQCVFSYCYTRWRFNNENVIESCDAVEGWLW